jgi:hypothetical protein
MSWWSAVPVALVCLAVFWLPGLAVLRVAGTRGLGALALAPAVTAGILGTASALCPVLGLRWGPPTAVAACVAVVAAVGLLARRRPADDTGRPDHGSSRWLPAALAAGVLGQLVVLVGALPRPDAVQNAWDALFHLEAVVAGRVVGRADPAFLARLADPSGGTGFYPHAWHAAAELVPHWAGVLVTVNVAALLPVVVATTLGTTFLARELFPDVRAVPPLVAVLSACGVALPLGIALQPALIPNAYAIALVPAVLALVVRRDGRPGRWVVVAVGAVGIGLCHPNALLGLLVLSLPWVLPRLWAWARTAVRRGWGRAQVGALAVAVAACAAALLLSRTSRIVSGIRTKEPWTPGTLAERLVTGNLGEWPAYPVVFVALTVVGAVLAVRSRRAVPLVVALGAALVLYVCASSPVDAVAAVASLWYTETRRLAPFVSVLALPLAAYGLARAADAASHRFELPAGLTTAGARRLLAGLGLALVVVPGTLSLAALAEDTYSPAPPASDSPYARAPYLTDDEVRMVARAAPRLDPDALLLGSSFGGAGHLGALHGQRVVQPYHTTVLPPAARYVSDHLAQLRTDPRVCQGVRELGARYVYVEERPLHATSWMFASGSAFSTPPADDSGLVDHAGTAAIYTLDVCY